MDYDLLKTNQRRVDWHALDDNLKNLKPISECLYRYLNSQSQAEVIPQTPFVPEGVPHTGTTYHIRRYMRAAR